MNIPPAPRCEVCQKAVYHAEQALGPARKVYHRPCLKCTECGKRLDSFQMQEHGGMPYCRRCHTTLFGTRDLRSGNVHSSPFPTPSPRRPTQPEHPSSPSPALTPASLPDQPIPIPKGAYDDFTIPTLTARRPLPKPPSVGFGQPDDLFSPTPTTTTLSPSLPTPANDIANGLEKTTITTHIRPDFSSSSPKPLPASTNPPPGTPERSWTPRSKVAMNLGTPGGEVCEGCGGRVYQAEGVSAVGKRWHKGCLKCSDCKTTLNPGKVSDRNGDVYCRNCYHKSFGPPGIIGR